LAAAEDRVGQEPNRQLVAVGHGDGPLAIVLQFADVAGPVIILQGGDRFGLDVDHVLVVLLAVLIEKEGDERRNVLASQPQRRQDDRHDVEPPVKVLAERFAFDLAIQIAVAGGDHADIDAVGVGVADALELALLQNAEQLYLQIERRAVDLVEKDRAGVSRFEPAGAVVDRAGEGPANVAE
jgi:hypothetical protein